METPAGSAQTFEEMVRAGDDPDVSPEQAAADSAGGMLEPKDLVGPHDRPIAPTPAVPVAIVDGPHKPPQSDPRLETGQLTIGLQGQDQVVQIAGKQPLRSSITIKNTSQTNPVSIVGRKSGTFSQGWVLNAGDTREFKTWSDIYALVNVTDGSLPASIQWFATYGDG